MDNVFSRAAEAIKTRGWRGFPGRESICLLQACAIGSGLDPKDWGFWASREAELVDILFYVLQEQWGVETVTNPYDRVFSSGEDLEQYKRCRAVWQWNDSTCRGGKDAIAVLEKAAVKLEERVNV